jgi:hypothetical protein
VVVNGVRLSDATISSIEVQYRVRIADARWWYDRRSGLFGGEGREPIGFFVANLDIGGPLQPDASNGHSDVFVNGRELTQIEVMLLERYFAVYPGRYWLDANGDAGLDGSPDPILNLFAAIKAGSSSGGTGGDNFFANSLLNTAGNSQGGCVYVTVDGEDATSGCG